MALEKILPESLVWVRRQHQISTKETSSSSIIRFYLRSNTKNQKISCVPVEIGAEEFIQNDYKSYFAILKLLSSSSLKIDERISEWIISDIVEKIRDKLPLSVTCSNRKWVAYVEIENNGMGFPYHKLCSNCMGMLPPGWTDTCQTCLQFL